MESYDNPIEIIDSLSPKGRILFGSYFASSQGPLVHNELRRLQAQVVIGHGDAGRHEGDESPHGWESTSRDVERSKCFCSMKGGISTYHIYIYIHISMT